MLINYRSGDLLNIICYCNFDVVFDISNKVFMMRKD